LVLKQSGDRSHQEVENMNDPGSPGSRPDEIPLERIEAEVSGLAGHLNAATCRLLRLIAEYDRRMGWASGGFRSCAEWLSWRAAMGAATARDHVRVARRLDDLPVVTAAFSTGELSFSQVRAITRVATKQNEGDLVMIARHCPASQLETLCRSYKRVKQSEGTDATNLRHAARYLHYTTDDYGMVVIRARLDPEDGAVVIKALEAAKDARSRPSARGPRTLAGKRLHPGPEMFPRKRGQMFPRKRAGKPPKSRGRPSPSTPTPSS
jgi:hypothetical protein